MALDFPSSPTNGQVYGNFIWSTAKGAWQAKPITGKVTTSATAPSAPSNGDEWFNTNDGNLYVYYTDVDGSQWVQVKSDATLSSTLGNRVELLEAKPSGLVPIIPSSISMNAGSASVSLLGSISFTGGTTLTVNDVFSSAYSSYRIVVDIEANSAAADVYIQLKNSGGTLGSGYVNWSIGNANGTVSGGYTTGQGFFNVGRTQGAQGTFITADINNPGNTKMKRFNSDSIDTAIGRKSYGINGSTAAYTGFLFFANGQTSTTGTLQVYGYR